MVPLTLLDVTPHEIVVCKPPGLASELPRDPGADSLMARLRSQGFDGLRLVHRLDAPACGVMVVARSAEAAAHYARDIAARRWQKLYVAAVACPPSRAQRLVGAHKAYLAVTGRRARLVRAGGKASFLTILQASPVSGTAAQSHVLVQLHTGRFHQIRVMLAALDAPLVGDATYGGPAGTLYLEHVALAARPYGGERMRVWMAPVHTRRPPWAPELAGALDTWSAARASEA